jgi:hypothetical protein
MSLIRRCSLLTAYCLLLTECATSPADVPFGTTAPRHAPLPLLIKTHCRKAVESLQGLVAGRCEAIVPKRDVAFVRLEISVTQQ